MRSCRELVAGECAGVERADTLADIRGGEQKRAARLVHLTATEDQPVVNGTPAGAEAREKLQETAHILLIGKRVDGQCEA